MQVGMSPGPTMSRGNSHRGGLSPAASSQAASQVKGQIWRERQDLHHF